METTTVIQKVRQSTSPTTGKKELVIDRIEVGQWVRQGDVYFQRLPDFDIPEKHFTKTDAIRFADGHVGDGGKRRFSKVMWEWTSLPPSINEFIKSHEGAVVFVAHDVWTVPHEEHAKLVMPAGCYASWNQVEIDPLTGQQRMVID